MKDLIVQDAKQVMQNLLQEYVGSKDVSLLDYKDIDKDMTKEQVIFTKARGSVRLAAGRIKTPADVKVLRDHVLKLKLP